MGIEWNKWDTGLAIANPAYAIYRLFGGKQAAPDSPDVQYGPPTATVHDITKTAAYQAQQAQMQAAQAQGTQADQQRAAALRALAALRAAPSDAAAPIAVNVPSFSLGEGVFEDDGW